MSHLLLISIRRAKLLSSNQSICKHLNASKSRHLSLESCLATLRLPITCIANSRLVEITQESLVSFHDMTGIGWCTGIAIITIALRTSLFPLSVLQRKILAKYDALKPEINEFAMKLADELRQVSYLKNLSQLNTKYLYNKTLKKEINRLVVRDNCHLKKAVVLPLLQLPLWVVLSISTRGLANMYPYRGETSQHIYSQFSNEGILWFTNLTVADTTLLLPILVCIVNLCNIQLHANERFKETQTVTRFSRNMTNFMRVINVMIIPIGAYMPSVTCFYWLCSSSSALISNGILANSEVKKYFNIEIKHGIQRKQNINTSETQIDKNLTQTERIKQHIIDNKLRKKSLK